MGNNSISHKIDAYAQANLKALKQEEAKTGRKMTKFDIAQYMLQHGKLNKNEYANWMNTTEGFNAQAMTQAQKTALKQGSVWGFAGYGGGQESYLDSMTSFSQKTPIERQNAISGHQMKLNETVAERKKKAAEMNNYIKNQRVLNYKKTAEEQKLKAHIDSVKISEADANKTASQLTREIEQQEIEMMSHEDRKKFIMDKFQDAAAKKDFSGMKNSLAEFNSYMCKYIDDKVGVTDVKDAIKEYSGLNALVDYVDNLVDDGDATNLSKLETAWNITKGLGDAVDGFIGAEGIEMIGALGTASKVATIANAGKYFAVATQGYFGVEGSQLIGAGLAHAQTAETEEEARLAGSEIGMGAIMLGGAVKSVKQGYRNIKIKQSDAFAREYVKTANDQALVDEYNARENYGVTVSLDIYKNELIKRGYKPNEHGYFETPKPTRPSTYRDELPTPDYSKTRENFPADAHQSLSKPGKATAYTTDGKPDGIVYQGKDGKMYVPNKWDPEHPYEVSTGADGKPASVIMIYDEAGGDFAVGDPTTIASTYKNPATGKLDPLYHTQTGKANAMEIVKDQVPSAYKIVKPGTEIQTKEGPRVVQDGEIVVYDTDGDPYVMPKKNFLKRQEPLKGDAGSEALYAKLKNGEAIPETEIASSGNATKPSAKTFTMKSAAEKTSKNKTPSADFASKLANTKIPRKKLGVTVKTKLTQEEINNLIENCQHGFITDGKPIPNYEARIEAVLNNPKELAIIAEYKNTVAGIWRAIQDPLDSTFEKNPELFADTKVKITSDSNVAKTSIKADIDPDAQLRTKLTEFKGPNGKAFLSKPEVENLIENCQHGFITDGKPIPNYEAKIEAVLNNPEEVASISGWKSRSAGIWRAIQDPLSSTVEANPELFGAKPKAEVKTDVKTQTKPSSMSPDIRNNLIEDLKNVKYDKQVTIDTMDQYPEFVEELVNFKVDGKQFFSMREVNDIIYNCLSGNDGLKASPERIRKVLNNPSEIKFMNEARSKAAGLWIALFR